MKGSVYKKTPTGPWYIRYDLPPGPGNKRRQKAESCGKMNKRESEAFLAKRLSEISAGQYIEQSGQTVAQYLEYWLIHDAEQNCSTKTVDRYKDFIYKNINPHIGHIIFQQLRPPMIQTMYTKLRKSGRVDGGGLSGHTVAHIHAMLHKAFAFAVMLGGTIPVNPCDFVARPKYETKEMTTGTADQIAIILKRMRNSIYYLPALLISITGMRRGEVCGLRWEDYNEDNMIIAVRRSISEYKGGIEIKETKTNSSVRSIKLAEFVKPILSRQKLKQLECKEENKEFYNLSGYICTNDFGEYIIPSYFTKGFEQYAKKCDIKLSLHGLRHSLATILASQGINSKVVQEILGHAQQSTTQNIYTHAWPNLQNEAAQIINEAFKILGDN